MKHLYVPMPWPEDMDMLRIKISDEVLFLFFCSLNLSHINLLVS